MSRYCNLNGITLPVEEARISIFDIGLQRGYGVFDVVRTYNKKLFHLDDHLSRLKKSAAKLKLILAYTDREILNTVLELVQLNNLDNPLIKFIITGGDQSAVKPKPHPNFMITVEPMQLYDNKTLY